MNTDNNCEAYTKGTTPYVACLMEASVPKDSWVPPHPGHSREADKIPTPGGLCYTHNEGFGQQAPKH